MFEPFCGPFGGQRFYPRKLMEWEQMEKGSYKNYMLLISGGFPTAERLRVAAAARASHNQ